MSGHRVFRHSALMITLTPYTSSLLEPLLSLYKSETEFEPHIALLTPDRFVELVQSKSYFDAEGLIVAQDRGEVVGWIHACVAAGSQEGHDPENRIPRVRMLILPRNRQDVGQALLSEAAGYLKEKSDRREFLAFHAKVGYPFYRGLWMGGEPMCPVTLPHVHLALDVAGYKNTQESIFMTADMPTPPNEISTDLTLSLEESHVEMAHEPMRESWIGFEPRRTVAHLNGEHAGGISWVIQPHLEETLGAPCMNIWGLGVEPKHRRKGIAASLVAHAMRSSYARGARFASVGTQLWNAPAHATYAKLGFVPHTILVGRTLDIDTLDT